MATVACPFDVGLSWQTMYTVIIAVLLLFAPARICTPHLPSGSRADFPTCELVAPATICMIPPGFQKLSVVSDDVASTILLCFQYRLAALIKGVVTFSVFVQSRFGSFIPMMSGLQFFSFSSLRWYLLYGRPCTF